MPSLSEESRKRKRPRPRRGGGVTVDGGSGAGGRGARDLDLGARGHVDRDRLAAIRLDGRLVLRRAASGAGLVEAEGHEVVRELGELRRLALRLGTPLGLVVPRRVGGRGGRRDERGRRRPANVVRVDHVAVAVHALAVLVVLHLAGEHRLRDVELASVLGPRRGHPAAELVQVLELRVVPVALEAAVAVDRDGVHAVVGVERVAGRRGLGGLLVGHRGVLRGGLGHRRDGSGGRLVLVAGDERERDEGEHGSHGFLLSVGVSEAAVRVTPALWNRTS